MLFLYGKILRASGYVVTEAGTGAEAMEALERQAPDLVILDWMMPGMSGLQVLEQMRARQQTRHLPVILLTAAGQSEDLVSQVFDLGASDFLTKPVVRRILLARVKAALDSRDRDELTLQSQRLSREKDELVAELEQARKVQRSQLPTGEAVCGRWRLSGGLFPCAQVGGDFFDVVELSASHWTIALVDVSGHGIAAAMVASGIRSTLRLVTSNTPLEGVLERLNTQLCSIDDGHYACVALVRANESEVQIVNAGLPPVVLMTESGPLAEVVASGVPPGLMPGSTYVCETFAVRAGVRIVLASDGFLELFDTESARHAPDALRSLIGSTLHGSSWEAQATALMTDRRSRQTDDATLVVLSHTGAPA